MRHLEDEEDLIMPVITSIRVSASFFGMPGYGIEGDETKL